jgi:hypothetical protein
MKQRIWACAALVCMSVVAADEYKPYRPTTEQVALARTLQPPSQPPGHNAYPVAWSLEFDMTPAEAEKAYQADHAVASDWARRRWADGAQGKWPSFPYAAAATAKRFPDVTAAEYALMCGKSTPSCLDAVRARRDDVRAVLKRHERLLARVLSLAGYDIWWNTMPPDPLMPVARVQPALQLWNTAAALQFVDGDTSGGLASACTAAASFRRFQASANTQLDRVFMSAGARLNLQLATDMLAAMPTGAPLPAPCRQAFAAPTIDEVQFGGVAANEWVASQRAQEMAGGKGWEYISEGWALALGDEVTRRAAFEDIEVPATVLDRAPMDDAQIREGWPGASLREGRLANLNAFVDRAADYVATLRMASLMLWLHEHPSPQSLQARLSAAPLGPLAKRISVGCSGRCLVMTERKTYVVNRTWAVRPTEP